MHKILIVDDDEDIVDMLDMYFNSQGYLPIKAYNYKDVVKGLNQSPSAILLDIMMPEIDGYEICKRIRESVNCPIIFLTAKSNSEDIIKGLSLGADDHLIKPFTLSELNARVNAHIRREERKTNRKENIIYHKNIVINLSLNKVNIKNEELILTKKELDILIFLSKNKGQIFSKDQIYEKNWGYDEDGEIRTISEHIKNIRKKIAELDDEKYITTVWGIGYRWE